MNGERILNDNMQAANPTMAKIITWTMLVQLAYMPFANIVHSLDPRKVFGYALWVTVLPTVVMLACYVGVFALRGLRVLWPVATCVAIGFLSVVMRHYWIGASSGGFSSDLNQVRYFALLPMYLITWREVLAMGWPNTKVQTVFSGVGVGMAIFGILHLAGLPTFYQTYNAEYDDPSANYLDITEARYTGTVGGSNVYGNVLVIPIIVMASLSLQQRRRFQPVLIVLILLGILSSGSRLALGTAMLAVIITVFRSKLTALHRLGILAFVAGFVLFSFLYLDTVSARFGQRYQSLLEGDLRMTKNMIAVEALGASWENAIIGTSNYLLVLDSANENQFSDNSYLQVATTAGIPATIGFIIVLIIIGRTSAAKESLSGKVAIVILCSTLLLNNAILWNVWLFMASAALWLIRSEATVELPPATSLRRIPLGQQSGSGFPRGRLQFGRIN